MATFVIGSNAMVLFKAYEKEGISRGVPSALLPCYVNERLLFKMLHSLMSARDESMVLRWFPLTQDASLYAHIDKARACVLAFEEKLKWKQLRFSSAIDLKEYMRARNNMLSFFFLKHMMYESAQLEDISDDIREYLMPK